jgi:hypothetical protein
VLDTRAGFVCLAAEHVGMPAMLRCCSGIWCFLLLYCCIRQADTPDFSGENTGFWMYNPTDRDGVIETMCKPRVTQRCFLPSWSQDFMPKRFHSLLRRFHPRHSSIDSTGRQISRSISATTCPRQERPALVVLAGWGRPLVGFETVMKPQGWPPKPPPLGRHRRQ